MTRRGFFGRLLGLVGVGVAGPRLLAPNPLTTVTNPYWLGTNLGGYAALAETFGYTTLDVVKPEGFDVPGGHASVSVLNIPGVEMHRSGLLYRPVGTERTFSSSMTWTDEGG